MSISEVTRRNIFEIFSQRKIKWYGSLEEIDFLSRLYDLKNIPSTDRHFPNADDDIRKHRILNQDWEDDWIFHDERFGFQVGDEALLLRFLCETLHPVVRIDPQEVRYLLQEYNLLLAPDGYELFEKGQLSGRPLFTYREVKATQFQEIFENQDISQLSGENSEPLLRTLARLFAREGATIEVAILANAKPYVKPIDNILNTGKSPSLYALYLPIPGYLYNQIKQYIDEIEVRIASKIKPLLRTSTNQIEKVVIALALSEEQSDWTGKAKSWLSGNKKPDETGYPYEGLLFNSQPAIFLYQAFKTLKVSFVPTPVFIKGGTQAKQKVKSDFLLIKQGKMMVVDIEEDIMRQDTPTAINFLAEEMVHVEIVHLNECDNLQKAKLCANRLLRVLNQLDAEDQVNS